MQFASINWAIGVVYAVNETGGSVPLRARRSSAFGSFLRVVALMFVPREAHAATQYSRWAGVKEARSREQFLDFP